MSEASPMPGRVRVVVVDDHHLFRSGLRRLLADEADLHVVGDGSSDEEAVRLAGALRPDVIVLDLQMATGRGIDAMRRVRAQSPSTAVLVLTDSDADDDVLAAILAGASGYLLKSATLPEIVSAIRAAADGESAIAPRVGGILLARLRQQEPRAAITPSEFQLSERELDVLRLLVAGRNSVEIADSLHHSPSTIKHHVASLVLKLGVENRVQAAVRAVRLHLV